MYANETAPRINADSLMKLIQAAAAKKGCTEQALYNLIHEGGFPVDFVVDAVLTREMQNRTSFPIQVNYAQHFDFMLDDGHYDHVDRRFKAGGLPIARANKIVKIDLQIVHFGHMIASDLAIGKLAAKGLIPCSIEHLLALGAQYPYLQTKVSPIACLGSLYEDKNSHWVRDDGDLFVPCLKYSTEKGRQLDVEWFSVGTWAAHCRFAAVPADSK